MYKNGEKGLELFIIHYFTAIAFGDLTNGFTRISKGKGVCWNIFGNQAFCADDSTFVDCDTRKYRYVPTNPNMVFNNNSKRFFISLITLLAIKWMKCSIDAAIRTNKTMCSNVNTASIHQVGMAIDKCLFLYETVITIIGVKGRENCNGLVRMW